MIRRMLVLSAMVCAVLAATAMLATSAWRAVRAGPAGHHRRPGTQPRGWSFTVEGSGCPPNVTVTIQINGITLGTVTSNGDGDFLTGNLTLPPSITPGQYTVHALCGSSRPDRRAERGLRALALVTNNVAAATVASTSRHRYQLR